LLFLQEMSKSFQKLQHYFFVISGYLTQLTNTEKLLLISVVLVFDLQAFTSIHVHAQTATMTTLIILYCSAQVIVKGHKLWKNSNTCQVHVLCHQLVQM